jgi:hypothetical protein
MRCYRSPATHTEIESDQYLGQPFIDLNNKSPVQPLRFSPLYHTKIVGRFRLFLTMTWGAGGSPSFAGPAAQGRITHLRSSKKAPPPGKWGSQRVYRKPGIFISGAAEASAASDPYPAAPARSTRPHPCGPAPASKSSAGPGRPTH